MSARLFRGFNTYFMDGEYPNIYRQTPREPKAANTLVHQFADAWFHDRFGVRARSATILCTTLVEQASLYAGATGSLAEIVPLGDYRVIYSTRVKDFLDYVSDGVPAVQEAVEAWLASKDHVCVNHLAHVPHGQGEIMLSCDRFALRNMERKSA